MKLKENTNVTGRVREMLQWIGLAVILALIIVLIRRILDRLGL